MATKQERKPGNTFTVADLHKRWGVPIDTLYTWLHRKRDRLRSRPFRRDSRFKCVTVAEVERFELENAELLRDAYGYEVSA